MKSLLFITHQYPINRGDASFIKSEISFLAERFNKVYILCINKYTNTDELLQAPKNVQVNFTSTKHYKIKKCVSLFASIFTALIYKELFFLFKRKMLSIRSFYNAISFLQDGIFLRMSIRQMLRQDINIGLIYTYWYAEETLSALLRGKVYKNIRCITRAHGYDLYKFRASLNYQPYKFWMDKKIDKVFFISQHGYNYYLNEFAGCSHSKYAIARLGIINREYKIRNDHKMDIVFCICSCSYIIPVKRIHLIINALENINDCRIHWIHIGDGPDKDTIESMANQCLRDKRNITYELKGFMSNDQVMRFYSENYIDCFISVSESEGLPVSMMEAISFGIPVIATNVGGVSELVKDTGILMSPDGDISEIRKTIVDFYNLPDVKKIAMRQSARTFWEANFSADVNHAKFSEELLHVAMGGVTIK